MLDFDGADGGKNAYYLVRSVCAIGREKRWSETTTYRQREALMSISVICKCGARFTARGEAAGKSATCPKCAAIVDIPKPTSAPAGAASSNESLPAVDKRPAQIERASIATMKVSDLPETVFVRGEMTTDTAFDVMADTDVRERLFVPVWSSALNFSAWAEATNCSFPPVAVARHLLLAPLMEDTSVEFLILDPTGDSKFANDNFRIESVPASRVIALRDNANKRWTWELLMRSQGAPDIVVESVMRRLDQDADLPFLQAINEAAAELEAALERQRASLAEVSEDASLTEPCSKCGQNCWITVRPPDGPEGPRQCLVCTRPWSEIEPFVLNALKAAQETAGTVWDEKQIADQIEALKRVKEWVDKDDPILKAAVNCPPPDTCARCGEANWQFESLSPNIKSATWRCGYCNRREIVRAGSSTSGADESRREPIPKDVQREVWRRDLGRCVDCGSRENLEFDHLIPVCKGGSATARNVQLLCELCNRRKRDANPGDY